MADSPISGLPETTTVGDNDLILLEQNSTAKKVSGRNWKQYFNANVISASATAVEPTLNPTATYNQLTNNLALTLPSADYIDTVELTSTSGLVDTYTITSKLGHTATFNVTNGDGGAPSDDTPLMDGVAQAGIAFTYSRSDHKHDSDTSRATVTALNDAIANTLTKDGETVIVWNAATKDLNNLITGIALCNEDVLNVPSATWWLVVSAGDSTTRTQTAYALFNSVPPKIRNKASNTWSPWDNINYVKPSVAYVPISSTWTTISSGVYRQAVTMYTAASGGTAIIPTAYTKVDVQPDATAQLQMVNDGVTALYISNDSGTLYAYAISDVIASPLTIQVTYYETA